MFNLLKIVIYSILIFFLELKELQYDQNGMKWNSGIVQQTSYLKSH
jgi:hypothetical protein